VTFYVKIRKVLCQNERLGYRPVVLQPFSFYIFTEQGYQKTLDSNHLYIYKTKLTNYVKLWAGMWAEAEAGSGSGPFSVEAEAEARKFYRFRFHIGYLTWRTTWRKIFVHFRMWIKQWSSTISLNEREISVERENEKKHGGKSAPMSHFLWYRA